MSSLLRKSSGMRLRYTALPWKFESRPSRRPLGVGSLLSDIEAQDDCLLWEFHSENSNIRKKRSDPNDFPTGATTPWIQIGDEE